MKVSCSKHPGSSVSLGDATLLREGLSFVSLPLEEGSRCYINAHEQCAGSQFQRKAASGLVGRGLKWDGAKNTFLWLRFAEGGCPWPWPGPFSSTSTIPWQRLARLLEAPAAGVL